MLSQRPPRGRNHNSVVKMNYLNLRNKIIVCFSKDELEHLFKNSKVSEMLEDIERRGLSLGQLRGDTQTMLEVVTKSTQDTMARKELIEIFVALFGMLEFYEEGSEVCFDLKNSFNPHKETIQTIDALIHAVEEKSLVDFAIKSTDGLRFFQLKQFRNELTTESLLQFIRKVLYGYGNVLGDVNLLIILQPNEGRIELIDWNELKIKIANLKLKGQGQILISYNENNRFTIVVQVYPDITISKMPITWRSGLPPSLFMIHK